MSFARFRSIITRSLLIAVALGAIGFAIHATAAPGQPFKEGRLLVQPRAGLDDAALDDILARHGGRAIGRLRNLEVHMVEVPPQAEQAVANALAKNPHIAFAETDELVELEEILPDDPYFTNAWHLPKMQAPAAWDISTGDGVVIAILDTGVDGTHPDLSAKLIPGWNSVSGNDDWSDIHGHGTAVAGTAAASTNNTQGVAAIAWNAYIMPVRITNRSDGYAYWSDIANGLTWAADNGAHVANISYGVSASSSVTSAAQYLRGKGGLVVVAGGNDGVDPGYSDNTALIAVSATTSTDAKASWSNYGAFIDVAAPGSSILTTLNGGGYGGKSGTSFASPATAAVVALIIAANPNLTPDEIEQVLEQSADNVAGSEQHIYFGDGRVNAAAAVTLALNTVSVDNEAPAVTVFSPTQGETVSGQVLVEVNANDNQGVTEVSLYVDGQWIGSDTSAPYQFSWNSLNHADGTVTLSAYAYDAAGNEGMTSQDVIVKNAADPIDTQAPTVAFLSPGDGATVSKTTGIQISAADDTGVSTLQLYIDGVLKSSVSGGSLSYNWNTRKEADGLHELRAVASDAQGNAAESIITVQIGGATNDPDPGTDEPKTNPGKGNKK